MIMSQDWCRNAAFLGFALCHTRLELFRHTNFSKQNSHNHLILPSSSISPRKRNTVLRASSWLIKLIIAHITNQPRIECHFWVKAWLGIQVKVGWKWHDQKMVNLGKSLASKMLSFMTKRRQT